MKIEVSKDWCMNMARLEMDSEIGAGAIALDPVFDGEQIEQRSQIEPQVAFGRFVSLMRRNRGLSVELLATHADVDLVELVNIEDDMHFKPEVRTVYQLSRFFGVSQTKLLQISGLTESKDARISEEAVRFAARSEPVAALSPEEQSALDNFVAVLSEQS
jgi:transcriptional regulator with XRE-family HTH domain